MLPFYSNVFSDYIMRNLALTLLIFISIPAHSELHAKFVYLEEAKGFESQRRYAGQSIAARAADLGFKRAGQMTQVYVDIGSEVTEGQPLAQLDLANLQAQLAAADADIAVAQAQLATAQAQLKLARNTEQRYARLRQQGHAPEQVYDEARLNLDVKAADLMVAKAQLTRVKANRRIAKIALDEATLYAPFSGVIQARYIDEGAQILPGQMAVRLVENADVEIHVGLPTQVASTLSPAQQFNAQWQNQNVAVSLVGVLPEVDPTTRTQTAVLKTQTRDIPLGSVVELTLTEYVAAAGFWVPLGALVESERGMWGTYVINDRNETERRLVEIIHSSEGRAYVRGTLEHGERLVSSGVHRLVPGQQVTPAPAANLELADAR